ncbi:MAG: hypothetical protein WC184_07670 [Acidimicrobiia bacterium]
MASITIRNVPDQTHQELSARAALNGQSLQEYLRHRLIELASRPTAQVVMARINSRKKATGSQLDDKAILAHVSEGRR